MESTQQMYDAPSHLLEHDDVSRHSFQRLMCVFLRDSTMVSRRRVQKERRVVCRVSCVVYRRHCSSSPPLQLPQHPSHHHRFSEKKIRETVSFFKENNCLFFLAVASADQPLSMFAFLFLRSSKLYSCESLFPIIFFDFRFEHQLCSFRIPKCGALFL